MTMAVLPSTDLRAHAVHFVNMHEAVLEDRLDDPPVPSATAFMEMNWACMKRRTKNGEDKGFNRLFAGRRRSG